MSGKKLSGPLSEDPVFELTNYNNDCVACKFRDNNPSSINCEKYPFTFQIHGERKPEAVRLGKEHCPFYQAE